MVLGSGRQSPAGRGAEPPARCALPSPRRPSKSLLVASRRGRVGRPGDFGSAPSPSWALFLVTCPRKTFPLEMRRELSLHSHRRPRGGRRGLESCVGRRRGDGSACGCGRGRDRQSGLRRVGGEAAASFSPPGRWRHVASRAGAARLVTTRSSRPWGWPGPAVGSGRRGGPRKRAPRASRPALPTARGLVPGLLPVPCF